MITEAAGRLGSVIWNSQNVFYLVICTARGNTEGVLRCYEFLRSLRDETGVGALFDSYRCVTCEKIANSVSKKILLTRNSPNHSEWKIGHDNVLGSIEYQLKEKRSKRQCRRLMYALESSITTCLTSKSIKITPLRSLCQHFHTILRNEDSMFELSGFFPILSG